MEIETQKLNQDVAERWVGIIGNPLPIHRLPLEILGEFFVCWAQVDHDGPWMAAATCRLWRELVLLYPRAWSHIHVTFPHPSKPRVDYSMITNPVDRDHDMGRNRSEGDDGDEDNDSLDPRDRRRPVRLWLDRAGAEELHVEIHTGHIPPPVHLLLEELSIIRRYLSRISDVVLRIDSPMLADEILNIFWEDAPLLSDLAVICSRREIGETLQLSHLPKAATRARMLERLTCGGCLPSHLLYGSLRGIESLTLQNITACPLSDFLEGIHACNHLVELHIKEVTFFSHSFQPIHPVEMASLRSLHIYSRTFSWMHEPLEYILTPNLASLRITVPRSRYSISASEMKIFDKARDSFGTSFQRLSQHMPKLKCLHVDDSYISDEYFIKYVSNLLNLRHLQVAKSSLGQQTLSVLASLPRLHTLSLDSCEHVTGAMLLDLVRTRVGNKAVTSQGLAIAAIACLKVRGCTMVNRRHVRALRKVDHRLKISFSS